MSKPPGLPTPAQTASASILPLTKTLCCCCTPEKCSRDYRCQIKRNCCWKCTTLHRHGCKNRHPHDKEYIYPRHAMPASQLQSVNACTVRADAGTLKHRALHLARATSDTQMNALLPQKWGVEKYRNMKQTGNKDTIFPYSSPNKVLHCLTGYKAFLLRARAQMSQLQRLLRDAHCLRQDICPWILQCIFS